MVKEDLLGRIGAWSFIIGLFLSVLAVIFAETVDGSLTVPSWIVLSLGVLGLIVGLLNVTGKEATHFLVAAIALLVASSGFNLVLSQISGAGQIPGAIAIILANISVFTAPAAVVVALRAIIALAATE